MSPLIKECYQITLLYLIEDTPDGRVELAVLTLLSMCWTLFGIKKVCVVY